MAPKVVCIIISTANEYVILHDKRDFASVINVKDLEMGRPCWIPREPSLIIDILKCRKPFLTVIRKGVVRMVKEMQYHWIEGKGTGAKAKKYGYH